MCGIVGIVGPASVGVPDPLAPALAALAARGPDGGGRHDGRLGEHQVVLGARRLALVDVGGGRQPFLRPSGSALVMNGEIYNHAELRRHLEALGETFRSRCDGEVLAALLEREGPESLWKAEGSYAFAFLQGPDGPLILGRDPLGVRPLAWARMPGGLVFASTLDAIVATGLVPTEPDLRALADVMRDGYVTGGRSALRGVHRLEPGEILTVGGDLSVRVTQVPGGAPLDASHAAGDPEADVLDALRAAVRDRLALDRPVGIFLSGGIDSALVAALARDQRAVRTFTVTFPGHANVDEGRRAARTAERLGLPHLTVPCPEDPTGWVLGAARAFDEPFGDASAIPTWGLGKVAGIGIRAALTGTGGDEIFGGYRRYWLLGAGPWLRAVPAFAREPVAAVLARTVPPGARLLRASADPEGFYRGLQRVQAPGDARALMGPRLRSLAVPQPVPGPTTAEEAMADDRRRYLPYDLLVKEDRALMAHAVEGRHPFLDRRVAAAAARLEVRGGIGRGRQKQVLRAYVREVIDPDLASEGKRGFAFPCDALYADTLLPLAEDTLLSARARERGFTDTTAVRVMLKDHATGRQNRGAVIHLLVMLELWARKTLDRVSV